MDVSALMRDARICARVHRCENPVLRGLRRLGRQYKNSRSSSGDRLSIGKYLCLWKGAQTGMDVSALCDSNMQLTVKTYATSSGAGNQLADVRH